MNEVRAAVMERPGRINTRHFPLPEPGPGAVLMRVRFSGVCGTDKHTFRGENKQYAGTPHERDLTYPLICGHENVGRCRGRWRRGVGQRGPAAAASATASCRAPTSLAAHCHFCRNGYPYYMCANSWRITATACIAAPRRICLAAGRNTCTCCRGTAIFRVPDELPDHVAVLTEIMAVTHGVEAGLALLGHFGGARYGGSVAVLGVGPLGLCHVIKSRLLGSGKILATDLFASRLDMAGAFGAEVLLDASATATAERVARAKE